MYRPFLIKWVKSSSLSGWFGRKTSVSMGECDSSLQFWCYLSNDNTHPNEPNSLYRFSPQFYFVLITSDLILYKCCIIGCHRNISTSFTGPYYGKCQSSQNVWFINEIHALPPCNMNNLLVRCPRLYCEWHKMLPGQIGREQTQIGI